MSLKDKLEIGLDPDAPYRPDNQPASGVGRNTGGRSKSGTRTSKPSAKRPARRPTKTATRRRARSR